MHPVRSASFVTSRGQREVTKGVLKPALSVRQLLRQYRIVPSKGLGQHFLVDSRVAGWVVDALELSGRETVLEIGAGFGALTQELLARGVQVIAVERDRRLGRALWKKFGKRPALQIVREDALRLDWTALCPRPVVVTGNIPYAITSPLLEKLAHHVPRVERAVLTVQRELAERVAAEPGGKAFGALTCFIQCYFKPELLREVSAGAFYPPPSIVSAVLRLTAREPPLATPEDLEPMTMVVQALFQRRRKMVWNGLLNPALSLTRQEALELLREVGVDPTVRPETLPVPLWVALGRQWRKRRAVSAAGDQR